MVESSTEIFET